MLKIPPVVEKPLPNPIPMTEINLDQADIKYFLNYIDRLRIDYPLVRVVSHSHNMKHFLDSVLSEVQTSDIFKDNVWSMFLQTEKKSIMITRHAYSNANYNEDAAMKKMATVQNTVANYMPGFMGSVGNAFVRTTGKIIGKGAAKFEQITEEDPGLTLWGIATAQIGRAHV